MVDPSGEWHMEVRLTESDGWTELQLIQHLDDPELAKDTGPGWEYYLDMLIASRDDLPLPDFADYYPRQSDHFVEQARLARLAAAEH